VKEALLQAIAAQEIPIIYEKKFQSIKESEKGVTLYFSNGAIIEASLVIRIDGMNSVVRT
jgi:2-polyprenyl-6-methoxyphenol hydroxylase-like FAD-dependent oxidoreductase